MTWHLTWQDPVALVLSLLGLLLSIWLRRRLGRPGCGGCAQAPAKEGGGPLIPVRRLLRRAATRGRDSG